MDKCVNCGDRIRGKKGRFCSKGCKLEFEDIRCDRCNKTYSRSSTGSVFCSKCLVQVQKENAAKMIASNFMWEGRTDGKASVL